MNAILNQIERLIADAKANLPNTRETAIVITKLEEAMMWCERGNNIIARKASKEAGVRISNNTDTGA